MAAVLAVLHVGAHLVDLLGGQGAVEVLVQALQGVVLGVAALTAVLVRGHRVASFVLVSVFFAAPRPVFFGCALMPRSAA